VFITLISDAEKAVSHWCCGEGEDHAGMKSISKVQESNAQDPPCSW